jgi:3-oxoacyl-[acyl-carrier protein] reductase
MNMLRVIGGRWAAKVAVTCVVDSLAPHNPPASWAEICPARLLNGVPVVRCKKRLISPALSGADGAVVVKLQDKVAVITGAGRGIGRAMAVAFAEKGAHVALIDLNEQDLAKSQTACQALGIRATTHLCNVTREAEVAQTLDAVLSAHQRLDIMINNAGITKDAMLVKVKDGAVVGKMTMEQWQAVVDVNLTGVFLGAREAAERMIKLGNGGVIISTSSISRSGNMGQTNYSATKAGVVAMTTVWAKELARFNIRAGAVAPGFTRTEILDAMKPEILERAVSAVPLKRMAEPSEMAQAAVFIAENDFFSGRVIEVDGAQRI